jgi:hypothetical protein
MNIQSINQNNKSIAIVKSEEIIISDVQSALDFIATIQYDTQCHHIALNKEAIIEDFFHLSTCIAGEIMQKFVNYDVKFAIIGDFTTYTSKALRDLIYESNHGNHMFFVPDEAIAIEKLSNTR